MGFKPLKIKHKGIRVTTGLDVLRKRLPIRTGRLRRSLSITITGINNQLISLKVSVVRYGLKFLGRQKEKWVLR